MSSVVMYTDVRSADNAGASVCLLGQWLNW